MPDDFAESAESSPGWLESYTASVGGSDVLATAFTRDLLGRIVEKVETIQGQTATFGYDYDDTGRLVEVTRTGSDGIPLVTTYEYDSNGNRLLTDLRQFRGHPGESGTER